ncbi:MAG: FliG C-terminal domain-containing protein [Leeuwenhoekiella sp.]
MQADQTVLNDFITRHPFAAAQVIERVPNEEIAAYFESLPVEQGLVLFNFMNPRKAAECFLKLPPNKTKEYLQKGDLLLLAAILKNMEASPRKKFLNTMSSERADMLIRQLEVLPNTVASIMETATIVTKKILVSDVFQLLKKDSGRDELYLYVVDVEGEFIGIIRPKELFLASPDEPVEGLMMTEITTFLKDIPVKSIERHPVWQDFQEIPIVDATNRLLGKLTHRSLLKATITPSRTSRSEMNETGMAIGELYRLGLTGLLQGGTN